MMRRPLRVALLSRYPRQYNRPRGGVESVTVVLARALARLEDLEIHVITLDRSQSMLQVDRDGAVTVHRLPGSRWPQIADILVGPGRKSLLHYLRELKPDLVHSHETCGLVLGNLKLPHVFTVHGFDHANLIAQSARFGGIRSLLWERVERYGLGRQRHVISITPYVRAEVGALTRAAIYDIDNPVDERFFNANRQEEAGRILCVGWIDERKNTLGSIEALGRVVARGVNAQLVIAGQAKDRAYEERVRACIGRNGLESRVRFIGHVDHDRLAEELGRAAVFLLPSRQENAPMAVAEAMAVGVPVIASNRCGMPFMVQERESGYLIDPEDSEQIADRLVRILQDSRLRQRMGLTGRRIAEHQWHPDAVARETRNVYRRVCGHFASPELSRV